jgi:elongation factor G
VLLERIGAYEPVLSQAIEAGSTAEREPLLEALARVADEDPSFRFGEDPDTGQLLISGMGELHLDVVAERLRREFGLAARTGAPQVLLREGITGEGSARAAFERTVEGAGLYGEVEVRVRPLADGEPFRFTVDPRAAALPFLRPEVRDAIAAGAREAAEAGVLEGWPLQGVEVVLADAAWREGESRPQAYKVAAADAVRAAAARAGPILLEPVMRVEIAAPADSFGDVLAGLEQRRGAVLEVEDKGGAKAIVAEAPLRRLVGYATELRSATRGRAAFTMRFDRFGPA